jgi:hypothetical protein
MLCRWGIWWRRSCATARSWHDIPGRIWFYFQRRLGGGAWRSARGHGCSRLEPEFYVYLQPHGQRAYERAVGYGPHQHSQFHPICSRRSGSGRCRQLGGDGEHGRRARWKRQGWGGRNGRSRAHEPAANSPAAAICGVTVKHCQPSPRGRLTYFGRAHAQQRE